MNVLFISLGCDKNLVDSEVMIGLLADRGYQMTDDETRADVIVINTCCFIHDAKEESIQTILEMAEYKKTGALKALIVTGCLAQRYQEEILEADYSAYGGIYCIRVATAEDAYGYTTTYWISVDTGLLAAAETYLGETMTYRMQGLVVDTTEPDASLFLLPDGSEWSFS